MMNLIIINRWFIRIPGVIVVGILAVGLAVAQEAQQAPKPEPPFINQAPAGSEWFVEVDPDKSGDGGKLEPTAAGADLPTVPGPPQPIRLDMKVGLNGIQKGVLSFSDGSDTVFFVVENVLYREAGKSGKVILTPSSEADPYYVDSLWVSGFPGVKWLAADDYIKVDTINSVPCYYFESKGEEKFQDYERTLFRAWVSIEKHYPIRVQVGLRTLNFSKVRPYRKDVTLPLAYTKKLEAMRKQNEALRRIQQMNP